MILLVNYYYLLLLSTIFYKVLFLKIRDIFSACLVKIKVIIRFDWIPDRLVRIVDLESLAAHRLGFESRKGLRILSCESAIYAASLQNVGGSTQVSVHAWNNAWRGVWGLPPPVKMETRHITYIVLVRRTHPPPTSIIRLTRARIIWNIISDILRQSDYF